MNPIFEAANEVERACRAKGFLFCFIGGLAVQRRGEPRSERRGTRAFTASSVETRLCIAPASYAGSPRDVYVRIVSSGSVVAARHAGTMLRSANGPITAREMPRSWATSTAGVSAARG